MFKQPNKCLFAEPFKIILTVIVPHSSGILFVSESLKKPAFEKVGGVVNASTI